MSFNTEALILASASHTRQNMFRAAKLSFQSVIPDVDEQAIHTKLSHLNPKSLAGILAQTKALSVSKQFPERFVVGADQTLEFESQVRHKAKSPNEAIENLRLMNGKSHKLHAAVSVVVNGKFRYKHTSTATLKMRILSEDFIKTYAQSEQEALLTSVGGYFYEGAGIHLFEKISGNIHTILGLPLLPLLAFLRKQAILTP